MTADLQVDGEQPVAEMPAPAAPDDVGSSKSVPRIWTVFVACFAAFAGSVFVQIIAAIGLVVWLFAHGGSASTLQTDLMAILASPAGFIAMAATSQIVMGLAAFIPARLSPEPAYRRLGLVPPTMPAWGYFIIAVGSLVPLAIGIGLAIALAQVIKPDESVAQLYEAMTWQWAVPFVLFIALVPGFVEETFFRGYIQRRLLERWSPAAAIFVTTVLFAIMHVMPHAVVNAFVLGLWLGVLAWRTGSVWPGAVSHAFVNGAWNVWQIGKVLGIFAPVPSVAATAITGTIALACFAASIWLLVQVKPRAVVPAIA
jgi:membrane protease YdiL (CAAX protease family)